MALYPKHDLVTQTAGSALTAAAWNEQVRDNIGFLMNPPACNVATATFTHNSSGNYLSVPFDIEEYDTDGMHSTSVNPSRVTLNHAGLYVVSAWLEFATNSTGSRRVELRMNGDTFVGRQVMPAPFSASLTPVAVTATLKAAAGNYVEARAFQNSTGSLGLLARMTVTWVGTGE